MDINDIIQMEATNLDEGTSTRIQCPVCLDNEDTLSITLEGEYVLFNCFRASCPTKGRINLPGVFSLYKEETRREDKTALLNRAGYLWDSGVYSNPLKLNISTPTLMRSNTRWSSVNDVLVTKVPYGYIAKRLGDVGELILKGKSKNYLNGPNVGKLIQGSKTTLSRLYIVEDIVSAMWVHQVTGGDVFCLFGTTLTDQMYKYVKSYGVFVWCLDNDTNFGPVNHKIYNIREKFPLNKHTWVVLDRDPKDYHEDDLRATLRLELC